MDDDPVRIGSYATAFEAEAVRGILEAQGIPSRIADSELNAIGPLQGTPLPAIGVFVHAADAARAAEILRRSVEGAAAARGEEAGDDGDGEPAEGKDRCVSCNAEFPEYLERCPACGLSYS